MVHCLYCSAMNEIVERVLSSASHSVGSDTREKVRNYISLLASTGKTERQLVHLGIAYLKEMSAPDPRYSGW
jgi:hypothetical protein